MKNTKETIIESPNFSAILRPEHIGKWVALSSNHKKLLVVEDTLNAVLKTSGRFSNKVVIKVLPNLGYAPSAD